MEQRQLFKLQMRIEELKLKNNLSNHDKAKIKQIEDRLVYGYHPRGFKGNSNDNAIAFVLVLLFIGIFAILTLLTQ